MRIIRSHWHRGTAGLMAAVLCTTLSLPIITLTTANAENNDSAPQPATTSPVSLPIAVAAPEGSSQPADASSTTAPPAATNSSDTTATTPTTTTPTLNSAAASPDSNTNTANQTASTPTVSSTTANNATTVNTTIQSTATSGSATVSDNRKAGDATSGSATATATVVNSVNSTTGFGDPSGFTYYTKDINAGQDMQGNILIDPSSLQPVTTGSGASTGGVQTTSSLTDITNTITLGATSGDATVSGNRKAGDATSGDATAIANIINVVGSQIGAKQTFLGVINIYGNLTGDIQVPADFVNSLLGGTSAGSATATGNQTTSSTTSIDNNITTTATSGDATVSGNRKAGDATSGDATTNITVFNLTGQQVIAKNSLLVFVNVLGKWVGVIVNQPGGSSAAFTGGQVGGDTGSTDSTASSNTHITNNISVAATSGDATVSGNRKAGDATSGNAKAGANLLNISDSNFSLDGWFGVLFINVLGSWLGNFGIDTPLPDPVSSGNGGTTTQTPVQAVKVFRFDGNTSFHASKKASSGSDFNQQSVLTASAKTDDHPTQPTNGGHVLGAADARSGAIVSKLDLVAFAAIVAALTLLFMLLSWIGRKFLAARSLRRAA